MLAPDPEPPSLALLLDIDDDAFVPAGTDGGTATGRPAWRPDHAFLLDWARHALAGTHDARAPFARGELSVRLLGEEAMRSLNRDWRGRDAPTNVLSFPSGLPVLAADEGDLCVLGDLALCPAVVDAEARVQGKPVCAHWAHLVVHGVLHLRGLDHEDEAEAGAMETLETRLLASRDLPDPYACVPVAPGADADRSESPGR